MSRELMDAGKVNRLVEALEARIGGHAPPLRTDLRVVRPLTAQERATEAWQWFQINAPAADATDVDQSPRARNIREINRIAMRYQWGSEVARIVDRAGVRSLYSMADDELDEAAMLMRNLVASAECGCDLADDLPAR